MDGRDRPSPARERLLETGDRLYARVENTLNFVAAFFIFFLMWLGVTEVVSRRLLGIPIPGHIDIVEVIMPTFAILGISYCQRYGGHVRMEIFVVRLRGRWMWGVELFGILVALFLITVLIDGSWQHFLRAWRFGDSTLDVQLPTWPSKLLVPIALAALWVRLFIQLWAYVRLLVYPEAPPLAVPQTKGMLDQAQEEAAIAEKALAEEAASADDRPRGS
jgi:C4-dicarboxylate transporter, DctQ subunit